MKNNSLGTKFLLLAVTLAILLYFGIQGGRYLSDPLTTTLAYAYQVEEATDLSGYVVRRSRCCGRVGGLLRLRGPEGNGSAAGGTVRWSMPIRRPWTAQQADGGPWQPHRAAAVCPGGGAGV